MSQITVKPEFDPSRNPVEAAESQAGQKDRIARWLAPYRRITTSGAFIPEIDGFRFVAIFFVFLYHLYEDVALHSSPQQRALLSDNWLAQVLGVLNIGVPLFFVVSGYVLGMPFAEMYLRGGKKVSLRKYFLRRVTRLEPPYILALLLLLVVKIGSARGALAQYVPHFLASVFYIHNAAYGTFSTINVVAWSLEIEVQFYILAPILALVFTIGSQARRRLALCSIILAAIAISQAAGSEGRWALTLAGYSQYFFAGLLLADIHATSNGRYRSCWRWDVVSWAGWPLMLALLTFAPKDAPWVLPWLIVLLYQAAFRGAGVRRFFINPVISTIGGMCYTIYLLHNYLIYGIGLRSERLLTGSAFGLRVALQVILMAPLVLLVSALYFRLIERPCMRPDWPARLARTVRSRFVTLREQPAAGD